MAKKTSTRKSRRGLKRTIRRSLAAILMITAIAVAAIPVPESLADDEDGGGGGTSATPEVQYVDAKPGTGTDGDYEPNDTYTKHEFVDKAITSDDVIAAIKNKTLVPTEVVIQNTEGTFLTWQFLYKKKNANSNDVILVKYNNEFEVPQVTIGYNPVAEYYTIAATDYTNYYSNPGSVSDALKADMDNLKVSTSEGTTTYAVLYPTESVVYTFEDFDELTGTFKAKYNTQKKKFLEHYFGEQVTQLNATFQAYYNLQPDQRGEKPTDQLSVKPSEDLTVTQKMEFFLEHHTILSGTGYSLVQARDYRMDVSTGTERTGSVYLAYGGNVDVLNDKISGVSYVDVNGYIGIIDGHRIDTIGEKAFYNVKNVGEIVLSGQVRYIGDSAFEQAGIRSLTINNTKMIGNRAFAGCDTLKTVSFGDNPGTNVIGAEAFRKSGINTKLELPNSIATIGYGAFSDCLELSEVEFDTVDYANDLIIKKYAFYNDKLLTTMEFSKSRVDSIEDYAFAIQTPSGDAMTEFSFPSSRLGSMGEYVLANRRSLKTVSIPWYSGVIPETTFYNCFDLERAQFSDDSATARFGSKLFYYVTNPLFCVYGPELYSSDPAWPRQSTWDAERRDGVAIPYVYESNGTTYYEVAYESEDGTRYRYGAGNNGELISCALISEDVGYVDIVIPSQIGTYTINRIGSTCFSDKELRTKIKSITIQNNSISEIANGTFRDLPKLEKVRIGNSVTSIGDNAFAGCKVLYDVYFATPSAGYAAVSLGNNAFATTGRQLTFHGDIVKGYAPFDYASDPTHTLKDPQDTSATPALNVCYQSLWDSTIGTHLTVISDKSGNMTLVDYPKFSDLDKDNIQYDDELVDYCNDMENYYYYTVYDSGSNVEQMRREYAIIFDACYGNPKKDSVDLDGDGKPDLTDQEYEKALNERYGPWINPNYCGDAKEAGYWTSYLDVASNVDSNDLMDLLLKPIVAQAAGKNPTPYFKENPYNFMENYESYLTNPNYDSLPDYKKVPDRVWNYINATQSIVVPDGVDSIDVNKYYTECRDNYDTYIYNGRAAENHVMYTSIKNGAVPGLFSGYYEDYKDGDSREKNANGNDYIKSVVLTSVKYLPDYAFDSCEQLERVELGAIEHVGVLPFRDCPNMTYLTGSAQCPAENGILYEKLEGTPETYKIVECLLSRGKSGTGNENLEKTSIAPDPDSLISSVSEIAESAFEGCGNITIIDLQTAEELEVIPLNCFKDCASLINVLLPRTVNKIRDGAFNGITSGTHPLSVTIPGREVDIADDAFLPKNNVTIYTYEDSAAYRYGKRYESQGMRVETLEAYRVLFFDYDGTQVGTTQIVNKDTGGYATEPVEAEALKEKDHRPGYTFSGWVTTGGKTLQDKITDDMTIFVAQYASDGTMVNGKYVVEFLDGIDGQQLSGLGANEQDGKYYIAAGTSFSDNGIRPPVYVVHDGYTFLEWSQNWTENTVINSNMTIIALYSTDGSGSGNGGGNGGGSGNTSRGSGNTSGGSGNTSRGSGNTSNTSSTSSSSTDTSSTTSASNSTVGKYTVTVENGSGSGTYDVGSTVIIAANTPAPGMVFQKWTTESNGVALASVSMTATTFTMPANNVTVTANYVAGGANNVSGTGSTNGNTGNTGNTGNGSTRVDITKPGISNKDLATANVNGSTDNFIVKITETDEATRAVADALTNKYGSLDNILYYAMDISLYDSTGTVKITNTSGLSVDITIPIPDALVAYGGNNMAGAVVNGNQLENLNESFTTINGVPCIRFTATHFSPYTIYVDTGNLTEGMLDATPKTGDPIHPKWFLSIGLASLSVILFMKRDKGVKVKTA